MENPIEIDYGVPPFMETAMDPPSDPQGKTCLVDLLEWGVDVDLIILHVAVVILLQTYPLVMTNIAMENGP